MSSCAVATCKNYYRKTKGSGIAYHVFPEKNPAVFKEWVSRCKRLDSFNPKYARICSAHFIDDDYETDLTNRLLGLTEKKVLKASAVPTINIPSYQQSRDRNSHRFVRYTKRSVLRDAVCRLETVSPKKSAAECAKDRHPVDQALENHDENCEDGRICTTNALMEKENSALLKQIAALEAEVKHLKGQNRKNRRSLAAKEKRWRISRQTYLKLIASLRNSVKKLQVERKKFQRLKISLSKIFTETQIKVLSSNKERITWSAEDISRGIIARSLSRRAYDLWKDRIGIPLPSGSTLKRWCSKFDCEPGILQKVLLLMKKNCLNLPEKEKYCILSFDEMHVDKKLCYDSSLDQILGPFSKVQFVLARGIISPWKQPVFFDFEKMMTKDLLFTIICELEKTGVNVIAVVSDLGGCGTLWKELNISTEKTHFLNPVDEMRKVWVFADPPHFLKLLRNHFIDRGLRLEDGTILTADIIKDVLEKDDGEIKLCHKLKPNYLTLKGNERQKVQPAKALFSATTAKAVSLLTGNKRAAEFFELVDSFFDIMNSSCPYPSSGKPMKAAFGLEHYYLQQEQILLRVKQEIAGMRVIGKNTLLPFQKGILISISSIFGLLQDMQKNGTNYILTSRLTQDALESLFSQIRGVGHFYDHPSPTEVRLRLRNLLLANKLPNLSNKINHQDDNGNVLQTYVTADLLNNAFEEEELSQLVNTTDASEDFEHQISSSMFDDPFVFDDDDPNPQESCRIGEHQPVSTMLPLMSNVEHEALQYIAGYVAYKVRDIDPSLGTISRKSAENLPSKWIGLLSLGGLTVPSEEWMRTVEKFEEIFQTIHGNNFYSKRGAVDELKKSLRNSFPHVCKEAIHTYSRVRTFIRIRRLNQNSELVSSRRRHFKAKKWLDSKKARAS